ncbi:hypothetical protein SODALDRAFT_331254 [Sodiomyces alkalinus F11]|uniref:Uncharacterized protein n=1 Tax=Sodiomyces alkalinus (strain CBS 110278 / VKM F-3762 / F11) TaxID=1314773 RepID=A0A3N2Q4I4_SODAK|nr:hypothetical protein SODALDRAFT_331254 [Sodiomyces alkalinus F11]ROT41515.1 hypothetical protein SODALDRAFT_331254 [Sodiomyces alkalinus F11]
MAPRGNLNPKTVVAPLAAFTMACVLFTYTRSSIRAARDEAKTTRYSASRDQPKDNER